MKYDILLQGGTLIDPVNQVKGRKDIALRAGKVVAIADELGPGSAARVINVTGKVVMPGIIDGHVHVCRPFGGPHGFKMMARVGVTTAIDFAGTAADMADGLANWGHGLNMGYVAPTIPGETIPGRDPDLATMVDFCRRALAEGAIGLKILGGHFPLTPEGTARTIQAGVETGSYIAVHAGTTATGSNMSGALELIELASGLRVHLAHINSYCRGQETGDALEEASRVLKALIANPNIISESYLATINGASAECVGDELKSNSPKNSLRMGGFATNRAGMEEAILAGWALINRVVGGEAILLPPAEGLAYFREMETRVGVSFPINHSGAATAIFLHRRNGLVGDFTVNAIATDGGAFPRNTIVSQGLPLVRYGAISLTDFVVKASAAPAAMLGLKQKGHLGEGADADVTVLDLSQDSAVLAIARGQVIMENGQPVGTGGCLITTPAGVGFAKEHRLPYSVIE